MHVLVAMAEQTPVVVVAMAEAIMVLVVPE
jgi:hypothetical protein